LRAISGLVRPTGGRIALDGRSIGGLEPAAILQIGIAHCPEGRRVFPYLTVEENLAMGAYVRRDRAGIAADLERVCVHFPILGERRRPAAGTLSGGGQQMLAIGRALMARPRILLLDEPSMGLAPILVETIFNTVVEINQQGVTVLLVEQNAVMALQIAHRGYVLETGTIVLADSAEKLRNDEIVQRTYLGIE
jgi:branched-chain amino acid transport system ATP-binding protein